MNDATWTSWPDTASEPAGYPDGQWTSRVCMEEWLMNRVTKTRLVHPDDVNVKPEPGPAGFTTVTAVRLKALGLPSKCVGGEIVEDTQLEDGTRWCVYQLSGNLFGFAYEPGPAPFGKAKTIELTILNAYDDDTMQQAAA